MESAAVNYSDVVRRRNDTYPFPTPLPFVPRAEVAGTVAALGEGVDGPPAGTAVFALAGADGSGGYAQYALARAAGVLPVPPGLDPDQAAGVIVAGATAVLSLVEVGQLQAGQRVLVQGAGGGVGSYAVQLAKQLGAVVAAAASTAARRRSALALGADHAVDHTWDGWAGQVLGLTGGVDLVLEVNGGASLQQTLPALAPFGRVVVVGMAGGQPVQLPPDLVSVLFHSPALNQSRHAFNLGAWFGLRPEAVADALQTLVGHLSAGRITVDVGHVLPLHRAADAHRLLEQRASTGKIVLKPWL